MNDEGYTFAEMLAALTMVGLAIVGLGFAVRTIASGQLRIQDRHDAQASWASFERAAAETLFAAGPFISQDPISQPLLGDRRTASFACGAQTCSVVIEQGRSGAVARVSTGRAEHPFILHDADGVELRYLSSEGASRTDWPPQDATARLAAIAVLERGATRAVMRVGIEQSPLCVFQAMECDLVESGAQRD